MRCAHIHCGRFNHRIDLQNATTPTNGEIEPTYASYATNLPAEVMETGGGETIRGRQIEAGINAVVTLRYRSDVTPRMRVKWGTRYLGIVSIGDPTGQKIITMLSCKELQP